MSSSKLIGKKRRNLQTKKILKKLRKVADMRAETIRLMKEIDKMEAAAKEKKKVLKLEKKKRQRCLTENLLLSETEHLLMGILFPPSGNC
ncbi:hypothetical protein SLE2022_032650 [Rubroshorea leprosula]